MPIDSTLSMLSSYEYASITDIIGEGVSATKINGEWIGSLQYLEAGNGYWVRSLDSLNIELNGCDSLICFDMNDIS